MKHPDSGIMSDFAAGRLSFEQQTQVEKHVETCPECCEKLSTFAPDQLQNQLRSAFSASQKRSSESPQTHTTAGEGAFPPELADHSRYRLLRVLGRGGMGLVYLAEHLIMKRSVAVKVIDQRLTAHPQAIERFRKEVRAAAALTHANIVRAYDAEQIGDLHFLVMEYVDGVSLAELVQRRGRLEVAQVCSVLRKVAQGLQHAHQHHMVHRDIKPQNIMTTVDGRIRILDFGLARLMRDPAIEPLVEGATPAEQLKRTAEALTLTGTVLGTPDYIAPEQAQNAAAADIRSDLYSLGCTAYFLLTGQPPYPDRTVLQKLMAHLSESPRPLREFREDIPDSVINVIETLMATDPSDRFQTPSDLLAALNQRPATSSKMREKRTVGPAKMVSSKNDEVATLPQIEVETKENRRGAVQKKSRSGSRQSSTMKLCLAGIGIMAFVVLAAVMWPTAASSGAGQTAESTSTSAERSEESPPSVSLLKDTNLSGWTVSGRWQEVSDGIQVTSEAEGLLILPTALPEEYTIQFSFTRKRGRNSVVVCFPMGAGVTSFELDAWSRHLAGLQAIDGRSLQDQSGNVSTVELINGQRYEAEVRVRRDAIEGWLDGERLCRYVGDGSNLTLISFWSAASRREISIGAYDSTVVFHEVRVVQ